MYFSYFEIVWSFEPCFHDLLGKSGAILCLGLIIPHSWGNIFLCTVHNAPQIGFSSLADGNRQSGLSLALGSFLS